MKKVKKMTQYEIHMELLRVLKEIDSIFKIHNIQYFLIFGTLLGCVRDGGYIPWDDDIDIAVMPEYWDKMNRVLENEIDQNKYFVIDKVTRPDYPIWHLVTRVGVNGTVRKMDYFRKDVDGKSGIFIDIFSMVKVPKNKIKLKMWDWQLGLIDRIIGLKAYIPGTCGNSSLTAKILCKTKYKYSSLYELNLIRSKIQRRYNNSNEKYVTVPFGPYGRYQIQKTRYKLSWVEHLKLKTFSIFSDEGETVESVLLPVPSEYDKILKVTYGEWRVRPRGERPKGVSYWIQGKENTVAKEELFITNVEKFNRDTEYWNNYYKQDGASLDVSLFAQSIYSTYLSAGKEWKILELGCGNGRDSRFFISKGYEVTAIDASQNAIEKLQKEFSDTKNSTFICGDFVNAENIFCKQYDFCYSRFSMHAISEKQEKVLIKNVFGVIKPGGMFFIEARGVNDELYGKGEKVGEDAWFYNGHFRRFIRKERLRKELEEVGFVLISLEESRGFAPYGEEDPMIIRCVASRTE